MSIEGAVNRETLEQVEKRIRDCWTDQSDLCKPFYWRKDKKEEAFAGMCYRKHRINGEVVYEFPLKGGKIFLHCTGSNAINFVNTENSHLYEAEPEDMPTLVKNAFEIVT